MICWEHSALKKGEGGRCCIKLESNPEEIDTEVAIYYILLIATNKIKRAHFWL